MPVVLLWEIGDDVSEPAGVDHLVRGLETQVGKSPQLRHPALQWHLATLEAGIYGPACLGALGPAARGLALGCLAAAHPGLRGARPRRGTQVMNPEPNTAGQAFPSARLGRG